MIGAYSTILSSIMHTIIICWTSFVHLVMSDAVENLSISAPENDTTFLNTLPRRSRPMAAPVFDATNDEQNAASIIMIDIPVILRPADLRKAISLFCTPTSTISAVYCGSVISQTPCTARKRTIRATATLCSPRYLNILIIYLFSSFYSIPESAMRSISAFSVSANGPTESR